jgi:hypothetical protein
VTAFSGIRKARRRIACGARSHPGPILSPSELAPGTLPNNKMQQTRSGHPRWRSSLLILVLGRRQHDPAMIIREGLARHVLWLPLSGLFLTSCFIDKPVADGSTDRSRSAKLFAIDCRAWLDDGGTVMAEAALIDFADGGGDLEYRWTADGVALPSTRDGRPRVRDGQFIKYSLTRTISHRFPSAGPHTIGVTVLNEGRSATCGMAIEVPQPSK